MMKEICRRLRGTVQRNRLTNPASGWAGVFLRVDLHSHLNDKRGQRFPDFHVKGGRTEMEMAAASISGLFCCRRIERRDHAEFDQQPPPQDKQDELNFFPAWMV
ncbi:hypothetical protein CDAR_172191 [Caerostris darwini]|uniref:Uncharacterized protein n=1 Tax=Caerostris darwini TaxID=1538125 RepID=A0AAV4U3F7_9ARAC|nr:hypothetical protein CDAR_172191 [Caerostris darwini]